MLRIGFSVLFFQCLASFSYASFVFTPAHQEAYQKLWQLHYYEAEALLLKEAGNSTSTGISLYLSNLAEVLRIATSEDRELFHQLKGNETVRLKQLNLLDKYSPYYLFTQAEVKLQWALLKGLFGENLSAAMSLRQAYRLLEENERRFPDFEPNRKSLGMLRAILGAIPSRYEWLLSLAGLKGNLDEGLADLQAVAQGNSLFASEARCIAIMLQTYLLDRPAITYQEHRSFLHAKRHTALFAFAGSLVALKAAQPMEAFYLLSHLDSENFPLAAYLRGQALLLTGRYLQAQVQMQYFLSTYKGHNYRKDAHYKLFIINTMLGVEQLAMQHLARIAQEGASLTEPDKYAARFAEEASQPGGIPDKAMLQVRLFADAGLYDSALNVLEQIKPSQLRHHKDQAEYHYRKGRVQQGLLQYNAALSQYQKVIMLSEGKNYYFAPHAALQSAYICRDELHNSSLAESYFRQVLEFKNYPYESSISLKAREGLRALRKNK
jgi:hypothetical protein